MGTRSAPVYSVACNVHHAIQRTTSHATCNVAYNCGRSRGVRPGESAQVPPCCSRRLGAPTDRRDSGGWCGRHAIARVHTCAHVCLQARTQTHRGAGWRETGSLNAGRGARGSPPIYCGLGFKFEPTIEFNPLPYPADTGSNRAPDPNRHVLPHLTLVPLRATCRALRPRRRFPRGCATLPPCACIGGVGKATRLPAFGRKSSGSFTKHLQSRYATAQRDWRGVGGGCTAWRRCVSLVTVWVRGMLDVWQARLRHFLAHQGY